MTSVRSAPAAPKSSSGPIKYLPGLDGLRAISVVAVMMYHAQLTWLHGGFLGVEVFFVISGYLITMLLMKEHRRHATIDLRTFWMRRARRLLPALYTLLLTVSIVTVAFYRAGLAALRPQVVAALLYVTNWYLIVVNASYFDQLGRPLVLRHLWSLAVEEQFYLVWPLIIFGLLKLTKARIGPMAIAIGGGALASAAWMAYLYTPGQDPSRVYYGTDTRASGLLIGALLALFWRPENIARSTAADHGRVYDVLGLASLAVIAVFFLNATETGPFLYRGGFVLLSLVTLVAIAAATHPATYFGRVLMGNKALTWVGVRSYGLYLWHWPIFVYTRPGLDVPWGVYPTLALRLVLTVVCAELSYRFIELPVRAGALGRWVATLRGPATERREQRRRITAACGLAAALVLIPVGSSMATATKPISEIQQSLEAGQRALGQGVGTDGSATAVVTSVTSATVAASTTVAASGSATTTTALAGTVGASGAAIVAIGDSVMLGAAPQLLEAFGSASVVDAKVGRNLKQSIAIAQALKDQGRLGERVVLHLGNNGTMSADLIAQMMSVLSDVDRVVWVNLKLPKSWETKVNTTLAAEIPKYPNATLVDWHDLAAGNAKMFYNDGTHLRPSGARFYTQKVLDALGD
jgi:peptidoglycan/LPS O-acetylase OafA/YrhL